MEPTANPATGSRAANLGHRLLKSAPRNVPKPPGRRPSPRRKKDKTEASAEAVSAESKESSSAGPADETTSKSSKPSRAKSRSLGRKAARMSVKKTTNLQFNKRSSKTDLGDIKPSRRDNASRFSKAGAKNSWKKLRKSLRRSREKLQADKTAYLKVPQIMTLLAELGMADEAEREKLATLLVTEHSGDAEGQMSPYDFAKALLEYGEAGEKRYGRKIRRTKSGKARKSLPNNWARQLSKSKLTSLRQAFNLTDTQPAEESVVWDNLETEELSGVGEEEHCDYIMQTNAANKRMSLGAQAEVFEIETMRQEMAQLKTLNESLQHTLEMKGHEFKTQLSEAQENAQSYLDQSNAQLAMAEEQLKHVRTQLKNSQHLKESLEGENQVLRDELAKKSSEDRRDPRVQELQSELDETRDELLRLERGNDELQQQLNELHKEVLPARRRMSTTHELTIAENTISGLRCEIEDYKSQIGEFHYLQQSNEELRNQLAEAKAKSVEAPQHSLRDDVLGMKGESVMAAIVDNPKPTVDAGIQTDPLPEPEPVAVAATPEVKKKVPPPVSPRSKVFKSASASMSPASQAVSRSRSSPMKTSGLVASRSEHLKKQMEGSGIEQETTPTRQLVSDKPHVTSLYQTTVQQKKEIHKLQEQLKLDTTQLRADNQRLTMDTDRLKDRNQNLLREVRLLQEKLEEESARGQGHDMLLDQLKEPLDLMEKKLEGLIAANQEMDTQLQERQDVTSQRMEDLAVMRDMMEANTILQEKHQALMASFTTSLTTGESTTDNAETLSKLSESARGMEVALNLQRKLLGGLLDIETTPMSTPEPEADAEDLETFGDRTQAKPRRSRVFIPNPKKSGATTVMDLRRQSICESSTDIVFLDDPTSQESEVDGDASLNAYRRMSSYNGRRLSKMGSLEVMMLPNEGQIVDHASRSNSPSMQEHANGLKHLEHAIAIGQSLQEQLKNFVESPNACLSTLATEVDKCAEETRVRDEKQTTLRAEVRTNERQKQKTPAPRESLQWDMFDLSEEGPNSNGGSESGSRRGSPVNKSPFGGIGTQLMMSGTPLSSPVARSNAGAAPKRESEIIGSRPVTASPSVRNSEVFFLPPPREFGGDKSPQPTTTQMEEDDFFDCDLTTKAIPRKTRRATPVITVGSPGRRKQKPKQMQMESFAEEEEEC